MARKEDRKKQKQRTKENKRAARHRDYLAAEAKANRYPPIVIDSSGANPAIVDAVRQILSGFSYDDPECCDQVTLNNYLLLRTVGPRERYLRVREQLEARYQSEQEAAAAVEYHAVQFHQHLGEWIFRRLPEQFTTPFSPEHFYRVDITDRGLFVRFELLASVGEPHNPLYVPPTKPTVVMQGVRWQVGLYRHALEQLCARLQCTDTHGYASYLALYFRFTNGYLVYEPVQLPHGQEALRVDFELPLTTNFYDYYPVYARRMLGLPEDHVFKESDRLFAVLGYLPLHVQGKYARAKTFLLPGFFKTPEYALYCKKAQTTEERRLLLAMTDENRRTGDLEGETFEAIKWYHDNGVPQVFERLKTAT